MLPPALIVQHIKNKLLKKLITLFLTNFSINAAFAAALFVEIATKAICFFVKFLTLFTVSQVFATMLSGLFVYTTWGYISVSLAHANGGTFVDDEFFQVFFAVLLILRAAFDNNLFQKSFFATQRGFEKTIRLYF